MSQSQGESADIARLHAGEPDKSTWVTCLRECYWADLGTGLDMPLAVHAEGCAHAGSRYIEHIPAPPPEPEAQKP